MYKTILLFLLFSFTCYGYKPTFLEDLSLVSSMSYQEMMGKNTPSWEFVQNKEEFEKLKQFENLYEKRKKLYLDPKDEYKIPKIIHFIWIGPKSFPPESVANVRSWIEKHPDWIVKFWTDKERPPPCKGMQLCRVDKHPMPNVKEIYDKSDNWGEKSDIFRIEIVLQEGGVYTDHDIYCIHAFDSFHKAYNFYGGLEQPHVPLDGYRVTSCNGLIAAKPSHPILLETVNVMKNRWEMVQKKYPENNSIHRMKRVQERTYLSLHLAIEENIFKNEEDMLFPASYFFASENNTSIYSHHFYEATWAKPYLETNFQKITLKKTTTIKKKLHALFVLGSSFFASFLCFSFFLRRKMK